jgi:hypothetical protein
MTSAGKADGPQTLAVISSGSASAGPRIGRIRLEHACRPSISGRMDWLSGRAGPSLSANGMFWIYARSPEELRIRQLLQSWPLRARQSVQWRHGGRGRCSICNTDSRFGGTHGFA